MTHTFRVWAPAADHVTLVADTGRTEMTRSGGRGSEGQWWECTVEQAGHGTRYRFSIDGGPDLPDPRSASQPEGVFGPSEVIDHGLFAWADQRWRGLPLSGAVLYELHVGTWTPEGTFDAAIGRIPHLVDLGVDAVEIMPVAEFSGRHGWGYDGVDLFAPHHGYGGPDGMKRFVDGCHAAGVGVILDVVYNHLGPEGNNLPAFGPYFTSAHSTNWGDAINFDGPDSDEVRRFVIDNALMWLQDYHCDGLRLDAVHAIEDDSATHLLEQMEQAVSSLSAHVRRPLFLIAESDLNDPRFVRPVDAGGYGLDAIWSDEWHHALHAVLTEERTGYYEDFGSLSDLAQALRQGWVYDGTWSRHRRRHHGRSSAGLTGRNLVVCTQNHDQVGNRALGDRLGALTSPGRLKVAAALLLTGACTPMLFQGEEWGAETPFQYFTDHSDPELGYAVSAGRRREFAAFGWDPDDVPDPQDPATFERSRLDWTEPERGDHTEMHSWYRQLIALRRSYACLSEPRLDRTEVQVNEEEQWIVVRRGSVTLAANLSVNPIDLPVEKGCRLLARSAPEVDLGEKSVCLPPDAVAIFETTPRRTVRLGP